MNEQPGLPARPTFALPGTPEKVEVMRRRLENGEHLYHPQDAKWDGEQAIPKPVVGAKKKAA